jgi:hypothetical protein
LIRSADDRADVEQKAGAQSFGTGAEKQFHGLLEALGNLKPPKGDEKARRDLELCRYRLHRYLARFHRLPVDRRRFLWGAVAEIDRLLQQDRPRDRRGLGGTRPQGTSAGTRPELY